ncbi:MAG: 30S ribosomal protein S20 [Candidatus Muirbacterium halophilum]|nr:30S ribosomal protein S20 [Candidatus Muirbacterium halophilum]MCK9475128.1 30S ribosomal protein S20 [Candidatus Muirbacterium halophilum]
MSEGKKRKHTPEQKRILQNRKRAERNTALKSRMKTTVKKFEKAVEAGVANEESAVLYKDVTRTLDKMVTKGILHKNTAARKKSRLSKKISN